MYGKLRIFYRRGNKKVFFSFLFTPESSVDKYVFQQVKKAFPKSATAGGVNFVTIIACFMSSFWAKNAQKTAKIGTFKASKKN